MMDATGETKQPKTQLHGSTRLAKIQKPQFFEEHCSSTLASARHSWELGHCLADCGRRKWQLTPVFLSGKFHGQRGLVDYIHGTAKLDTAEVTKCGHLLS